MEPRPIVPPPPTAEPSRLTRARAGRWTAGLIASAAIAALAGTAGAQGPVAGLTLSGSTFRAGDTLTVGLQAANPAGNPPADLLVGVVLPDGVTARFFLAPGGLSAPVTLGDLRNYPAYRAAPAGFAVDAPVFLRYTFPAAGLAPGTYQLFAALVRQAALAAGALGAGDLLALDLRPLVYSPLNTFLPMLRKPFSGEYRLTNFFDHNVPLEFTDTNGTFITWWGEETTGIDGHEGFDWHMPEGTPILAAADGDVLFAGLQAPRFCPPLGTTVAGNLVRLRHVAPNGEEIRTSYHHLSRVDVAAGQRVQAGQVLGLSGNTGCSTGPHLHFEAYRRNPGGLYAGFAQVDPYGWDSPGPDPWAQHPQGAPSAWLWLPGEAPAIFKEVRLEPNPQPTDRASVALTALRLVGWQDALSPNNEFVELTLDARFAPGGSFDLTGFSIRNSRGTSYTFPGGFVIRAGRPVRVYSGAGTDTETALFWGRSEGVWDEADNCAHLVRPDGRTMYRLHGGSGCN